MNKNPLNKTLVITGVVLAWLPLLLPLLLSALSLIVNGVFRFDYLMPAELVLVALLGGGLLLLAALRLRSRWRHLIGWGLGVAVLSLVGSQGLAVLAGLASDERKAVGWPVWPVLALLAGYTLSLVAVAIGGVFLARQAFQSS